MREFKTGATRDTNEHKLEYARFFSHEVLKRRAEYMHKNRLQTDGKLRDPDNWKKGIPKNVYLDSAFRHFFEIWEGKGDTEEAICALMFNCEGMLYEILKEKNRKSLSELLAENE